MTRVRRLTPGALPVVAVGAYANACAGVFLFDDQAVILDDARLASAGAFVAHVGETIRPFTTLTFLVDRQLYAVLKSPGKARPHTNLGHAWFEAGQVGRALVEFRTALSLDPYDPVAKRNLLEAWKFRAGPRR
jgi:hypothetical protein